MSRPQRRIPGAPGPHPPAPLVTALVTLATLLVLLAGPTVAPAAAQEQAPTLRLVERSAAVTANGVFELAINIDGAPPDAELIINVQERIRSRSQFQLATRGIGLGTAVASSGTLPLADLPLDANGNLRHRIDLNARDGSLALEEGQVHLPREGVYPVLIRLNDADGSVLDQLVTNLIRLPDPTNEEEPLPPLGVAWSLEIGAPPGHRPDGSVGFPAAVRAQLRSLIELLDRHHELPVTVDAVPETLVALRDSPDPTDTNLFARLTRPSARTYLTGEYVRVDPVGLSDAGLDEEATTLATKGRDTLTALFGEAPRTGTVVAASWTSDRELERRWRQGARELVVPDELLEPAATRPRLSVSRPIEVLVGEVRYRAALIDEGLRLHFEQLDDPTLAALTLVDELAVIWFERPAVERAVLVRAPEGWDPNPRFLSAMVQGLDELPLLELIAVDDMLDLDLELDAVGQPLVREISEHPARRFTTPPGEIDELESALRTLDSTLTDPAGRQRVSDLRGLISPSWSFDLTPGDRSRYWQAILDEVNSLESNLSAPPADSFTLTSRSDSLPLRFRNSGPYDLRVRVELSSDKLEFPEGAVSLLELPAGQVTDHEIQVRVRSSGSFPLDIEVASADGSRIMSSTRVTVRSTVLSRIGIFLTAGAALFLAVWWATHWRRSRRTGLAQEPA